jgi:hypothetical protein
MRANIGHYGRWPTTLSGVTQRHAGAEKTQAKPEAVRECLRIG